MGGRGEREGGTHSWGSANGRVNTLGYVRCSGIVLGWEGKDAFSRSGGWRGGGSRRLAKRCSASRDVLGLELALELALELGLELAMDVDTGPGGCVHDEGGWYLSCQAAAVL